MCVRQSFDGKNNYFYLITTNNPLFLGIEGSSFFRELCIAITVLYIKNKKGDH